LANISRSQKKKKEKSAPAEYPRAKGKVGIFVALSSSRREGHKIAGYPKKTRHLST
jgi:hypothetical protein